MCPAGCRHAVYGIVVHLFIQRKDLSDSGGPAVNAGGLFSCPCPLLGDCFPAHVLCWGTVFLPMSSAGRLFHLPMFSSWGLLASLPMSSAGGLFYLSMHVFMSSAGGLFYLSMHVFMSSAGGLFHLPMFSCPLFHLPMFSCPLLGDCFTCPCSHVLCWWTVSPAHVPMSAGGLFHLSMFSCPLLGDCIPAHVLCWGTVII